MPPSCMLDGVHSQHFFGTGVIIYHSQSMGLVAVDKNTVAISASDVMLSFAAFPIEIPGEVNNFCNTEYSPLVDILFYYLSCLPHLQVVFLHPVHNYALITYDPSALGAVGSSAVRAAELLPGWLLFMTSQILFTFVKTTTTVYFSLLVHSLHSWALPVRLAFWY